MLARPERFERPTPRFVVWCSIQLSYGRVPEAGDLGGGGHESKCGAGFAGRWLHVVCSQTMAGGMRWLSVLTLLSLLSGCAGMLAGEAFPSLAPRPGEEARVIEAPGGAAAPRLTDEERAGLGADLARERRALAEVRAAIRRAEGELDRALAAARRAAPGSGAWAQAQMMLSRLEAARTALDAIAARTAPLDLVVDSLPADDPDRRAVEMLARDLAAENARTLARTQAATRAIGG